MKLISAVQGSGGGSGDGGGVVGGGQQQILISVPTSQHLGNIRALFQGGRGNWAVYYTGTYPKLYLIRWL